MAHEIVPPYEADSPAHALLKRLRAKLSQTEISKRTGIPQPTLSRWENGGPADAADDALKLAQLESELGGEPPADKVES